MSRPKKPKGKNSRQWPSISIEEAEQLQKEHERQQGEALNAYFEGIFGPMFKKAMEEEEARRRSDTKIIPFPRNAERRKD